MTPQQITLFQKSFADVKPIAGAAAELFYTRLFALDPSLRSMFKGDITRQGQMLMSMIGTAVMGLSNLETLAPVVRKLGRAMSATVCATSTTPPSAARSCGRWNKVWARSSRPPCMAPGPAPTSCCPT